MGAARLVIMELSSSDSVRRWREHSVVAWELAGVPPVTPGSTDTIVWQLASANHRALARSVRAYPTVESAVAATLEIAARADELAGKVLRTASPPLYAWVATLDSTAVVASARRYSTIRDVHDATSLALTTLASVSASSVVVAHRMPVRTASTPARVVLP